MTITNDTSLYGATIIANEALAQLENIFGYATNVDRALDDEIKGEKWDTVKVRIRQDFTATAVDDTDSAGTIAGTAISPTYAELKLDQWFEVAFYVSQKDLSTKQLSEKIVSEHIQPAASALANKIEQQLAQEAAKCKYFVGVPGSAITKKAITNAGTKMTLNKTPFNPRALIWEPTHYDDALNLSGFTDPTTDGGKALQEGQIGRKLNFNHGQSQNAYTLTPSDPVGAVNDSTGTDYTGLTTLPVDGFSAALPEGALFQVAGETGTPYHSVVSGTTTTTLKFYPALVSTVANNAVITAKETKNSFAFHPGWANIAFATLDVPETKWGVESAYIRYNGIGIKVTMFYEPTKRRYWTVLEALWGYKVTREQLGCKIVGGVT